jgi:multiple sugar transport system permease protein
MAIISRIGRKSLKVRALLTGIYALLILGSISMIYPFLLMLSGSTKGAVDIKYFNAVPRFLRDDGWLYRKHMEALFNERLIDYNITYDTDASAFDTVVTPETNERLLEEWNIFLKETPLPDYAFTIGHLQSDIARTIPMHLRKFKAFLRSRHGASVQDLNSELETEFIDWNTVVARSRMVLSKRDISPSSPFSQELSRYKSNVVPGMRIYASPEGYFKKAFLKARYSTSIDSYNDEHGTDYSSYRDVHLTRALPSEGTALEQSDWEEFTRNTLAPVWIRASEKAAPAYRSFLESKYQSVDILNNSYGTVYKAFSDIDIVAEPPPDGLPLSDWQAFVAGWKNPVNGEQHALPVEHIRVHSTEFMFRDWLRARYATMAELSQRLGQTWRSHDDIPLPQAQMHLQWYTANRNALLREFAVRNYLTVFEYLLLHGRGLTNTFIYCALSILLALRINPMAAYAMSRYKMPSTYKILLFLMCTMAFPPMVTQIPNFLMLRRLGLLNTFAALVLPGMANGYSIFLLKGFFDSQPRELYESAQLDGAGEWTIFWQITMSLSKPILAVIALQAFTLAYSNFMFAFIVCQDQKMWTLMVWLYQLQQRSGQAVMYASLIIAAIPTFLIFLFCQKIIMRGIVVPSEK